MCRAPLAGDDVRVFSLDLNCQTSILLFASNFCNSRRIWGPPSIVSIESQPSDEDRRHLLQ
jgi:hypothetical protein